MGSVIRIKPLILAVLMALTLSLSAGIIEYQDDDQYQYVTFSDCDSSIHQIVMYISLDPNSGWVTFDTISVSDTVYSAEFNYIATDVDEFGNKIPGVYQGEYWYYTISIYYNGDAILSSDTVHQTVSYTIGGGCLGTHYVD